jgi:hypothetical protein
MTRFLLLSVCLAACSTTVSEEEQMIRSAYDRVSVYTPLAFSLEDFHRYDRGELAAHPASELIVAADRQIALHRDQRQDSLDGESSTTVGYRTSFVDAPKLEPLKMEEVLARLEKDDPQYREVIAVTSYRVRTGDSSYRAAVMWKRSGELMFAEPMLPGIAQILAETLPPIATSVEAPSTRALSGALCNAEYFPTDSYTVNTTDSGASSNNGHLYGYHGVGATLNLDCSCTAQCESVCQASVINVIMHEHGQVLTSNHQVVTGSNTSTDREGSGKTTPAKCALGFKGAQKACFFGACGISIAVSVSGVTVSYVVGGNPDWTSTDFTRTRTCPLCSPVSGGGGGTTSGGTIGGTTGNSCTCGAACNGNYCQGFFCDASGHLLPYGQASCGGIGGR